MVLKKSAAQQGFFPVKEILAQITPDRSWYFLEAPTPTPLKC